MHDLPTRFFVLHDAALLGSRYPRSVSMADGSIVRVVSPEEAKWSGHPTAGVIQDRTFAGSQGNSVKHILGTGALREMIVSGAGDLDIMAWEPVLPWRFARDVLASRELVRTGKVGEVAAVHVVSYHGTPASSSLHSGPVPASELEAWVFGADLVEHVIGEVVTSVDHLRHSGAGTAVSCYSISGGSPVVHDVRPVALSAGQGFRLEIVGTEGRLLLRSEATFGAITIWNGVKQRFEWPAVHRERPSSPLPSSIPGGWEMQDALRALLANGDRHSMGRDAAVRLIKVFTTDRDQTGT